MTHSRLLLDISESIRGVTARIMGVWTKATDSDKEAGSLWYVEGGRLVDRLATQSGRTRETVAAVLAHLSPRTRWTQTVTGATSLLLTGQAPGHMGANVERARHALKSDHPLDTINGPKTRCFARNLLGDTESVTIDVWALRVAMGDQEYEQGMIVRNLGLYRAFEHCYRLAARRAGVEPATMQATTWIVARGGRSS